MVRHIEYDSDAEAAYDEGLKGAVVGGRGWWRVLTEYESPSELQPEDCHQADPRSFHGPG
jgi:hypothetical protein